MGGEPYRIMELKPYIGVERATSSVILYVMMHIFSHFCFWLSSVLLYLCLYPVGWVMGTILGTITVFCLLVAMLFVKGYQHGMAVAFVRLGSHLPFLKKKVIRFADSHREQLENIDKQIALLHQQKKELLCRFILGIYGTCGQLSGNLADPQCADKECQFCRLLPDCCLLFFTGQSFVLLAYAVGWP